MQRQVEILLAITISPAAFFSFWHFFLFGLIILNIFLFFFFVINLFFYFYIHRTRISLNYDMYEAIQKISLMHFKLMHVSHSYARDM